MNQMIDILLVAAVILAASTYILIRWKRRNKSPSGGCSPSCNCPTSKTKFPS